MKIEGLARNVGTHAAAVVIADRPLTEYVPLQRVTGKEFGLSAIKGCGGQAAEVIRAEREANGPFRDLFEFCERCDPSGVNRTAIESLIKAGAFDACGGRRAQ